MQSQPGDILIWKVGDSLYTFGHAAIVVAPEEGKTQMVQTCKEGLDLQTIRGYSDPPTWVFQCEDSVLSGMAADTARHWAEYAYRDRVRYGYKYSFWSLLGANNFGRSAEKRAIEYRLYGATNGPSPLVSQPHAAGSGLFAQVGRGPPQRPDEAAIAGPRPT